MSGQTIGFVGLGRLGSAFANVLLEEGYAVACCRRGRSEELVEKGAEIPGDGSPRAVAEAAEVVMTCLPGEEALEQVVTGDDGFFAGDRAPVVVELSTAPIAQLERLREGLAERGGDLLDSPVSGTPPMAAAKQAVIYSSGDRDAYDRVADVVSAISPNGAFVGELGAGTKLKYVANLLAFVHVTAASEAMALAGTAGLDLEMVAKVVSESPGAMSGQFKIRAPLMAQRKFDSSMVTVDMQREVFRQIEAFAGEMGASTPLLSASKELYDDLASQGEGQEDPAKLSVFLMEGTVGKTQA